MTEKENGSETGPAYVRPRVRKIAAYQPGEQPQGAGYIKLNTNENPYPPSPRVLEALRSAAGEDLRLYPDPMANALRRNSVPPSNEARAPPVAGSRRASGAAPSGTNVTSTSVARSDGGPATTDRRTAEVWDTPRIIRVALDD